LQKRKKIGLVIRVDPVGRETIHNLRSEQVDIQYPRPGLKTKNSCTPSALQATSTSETA